MLRDQSSCRFTVVIPTFSRPAPLRDCLESLARMNVPAGGFEVVVVDDGSPRPLRSVVAQYQDRLPVRYLRQSNSGPATARNFGASQAHGTYLVFLDDDCQVEPDWLVELEAAFAEHPDSMWGGLTLNRLDDNRYSSASQIILDMVLDYYNPSPEQITFLTSNNLAMPAERFEELGGFDARRFSTAGAEDRDLCDRWVARFGCMRHARKAVIGHYHQMNLRGFWKQNFTYGRGAWTFHRIRSEEGNPRLQRDARFHLRLPRLLGSQLSRRSWGEVVAALPLLAVWQVANLLGFLSEGWRQRQASRRFVETPGSSDVIVAESCPGECGASR